jgi:hypothetical protein
LPPSWLPDPLAEERLMTAQRRQIIGDLAVVLHQALRGPGYLPIRPRDAVLRLQEDLGIADGAEPGEIESKLTAALECGAQ